MNRSIILHIIGWILTVEAALMALPALVALIYQEQSGFSFLITMGLCLLLGVPLLLRKRKSNLFFSKEGFISVALGWVVLSIMGALPFYISGEIPSYVDALFEIISGFTTTGSSILRDVEALSKCMIFWRSFTHWIGGMGILVFILAILPMTGGERMHILRAESPGPSISKLTPRMKTTAFLLYAIYLVMTFLQIILLLIGDMPAFDAVTITLGTAGTGGFSIKNSNMANYTGYQQLVVTIFMFLFGVNFNVYYLLLFRRFKDAFKSEELRSYCLIVLSAIVLIALNLGGVKNFFGSLHPAAFQVSSIITTTGYATVDFNTWPVFSKSILVILMFFGACAGSTAGGMKISRIVILAKTIGKELSYLVHKRSIKILKFDGNKIEHEVLRSINVFFAAYIFIFAGSVLIVSLDNFDFTTSFTAVAATLNNVGPGLELVGPMGNFASFSHLSKFVMMFDMLAGRLEVFPLLLLLTPSTWKK
jgi:trk system potassium uptake protein TrkH